MSSLNAPNQNMPDRTVIPLMTLREVVMFPKAIVPLFVGREKSIEAIETAIADYEKQVFLVAQKDPKVEMPAADDLYSWGCMSKILQMFRLPDGTIKVLFEGVSRARIDLSALDMEMDIPLADVTMIEDKRAEQDNKVQALMRATREAVERFGKINSKISKETVLSLTSLTDPGQLADSVLPHLKVDFRKKQELLEETDPGVRLEKAHEYLQGEIEVFSLEKKIKSRVKKQMEGNQKDYYLSEQLKAIHKEMGRETDPKAEMDALEEKINAKELPDEARDKALEELKKLKMMSPSSAEYSVLHNYIDWILSLPWQQVKATEIDIDEAEAILEKDHYGLKKPKQRILEYLAVQALVEKLKGPILCFVGPPGVGKTSLARSVARATDREFVRLSLGGVRDEAEIRGHRRTYVGALPGKILQSLKKVDYNNPVFCMDEIDKMSTDFRGDPSAALLEVLDPEQNSSFNDHYLDLDYDLSNIFFITTANSLHTIPVPLQDRMEIIRLPGYLETEKKNIAKRFLLPKQIETHGFAPEQVQFSEGAFLEVIRRYTREAGVRSLEREIASICRKAAKNLVKEGKTSKKVKVSKTSIAGYLGVPKVRYGRKEDDPLVGVSTGLAWTEVGGELLMVEVALMPGTGKIEITGKLGDVMQESAKAAFSYVRSRSELFGLKSDFYKEIDVHVHVPEGATPKDGPSAGITLATSLVSSLLNHPVRNDLAMTGEITLRGRVLPIGGLREKLLAAQRGLISTVLIPEENAKDLEEVPDKILKGLEIIRVNNMDDVLRAALITPDSRSIFCGRNNMLPLTHKLIKEEFQIPTH
ncbi:MAG: endopeptidase La [Thermodesulfobacteriota bacterium]